MELFWFVVEARSLAREFETEKSIFDVSLDNKKNIRDVSIGEKCQTLPLRYDNISVESFDKAAGDNYEQRPTHIA